MGIMKTLAIALVFIIVGAVVAAAALTGMVPILSDAMGTSKPIDLGVKYTEQDYQASLAKVPGHSVENAEELCITCPMRSSGSVPIDATFTNAEITAQMNKLNAKNGNFKDVQVRFNADGTLETSGRITDPRINAPIYAKGRIIVLPGRTPVFEVEKLYVGRIQVRPEDNIAAQGVLNQAATNFFNQNPGISIGKLDVQQGQISMRGTWPEKMSGIPGATPYPIG